MRASTLVHGISVTLVGILLWWGWQWLQKTEEVTSLHISAAHDVPELHQPVYAQFSVTQRIVIPHLARINQLKIPIYVPKDPAALQIDLKRPSGTLLSRWRYIAEAKDYGTVTTLSLPLVPPRLLEDTLEITWQAPWVTHEKQHQALGLFLESSDEAYPAGNYRIADQEKKGDVALQLTELKSNYQILEEVWRDAPLQAAIMIVKVALTVLMIYSVPWLVYQRRAFPYFAEARRPRLPPATR